MNYYDSLSPRFLRFGDYLDIHSFFQLLTPSAFDEAGLTMLDSIREIFDILDYEFETVGFDLIQYKNFEELADAINDGKCPIADILMEYIDPKQKGGSHAMVATGLKNQNGIKCIQLKNSYADDPNKQGNVPRFNSTSRM